MQIIVNVILVLLTMFKDFFFWIFRGIGKFFGRVDIDLGQTLGTNLVELPIWILKVKRYFFVMVRLSYVIGKAIIIFGITFVIFPFIVQTYLKVFTFLLTLNHSFGDGTFPSCVGSVLDTLGILTPLSLFLTELFVLFSIVFYLRFSSVFFWFYNFYRREVDSILDLFTKGI